MEETQARQAKPDGFAFEDQITELDSFIKATNIIFKKLANGCDEEERYECMGAMHGVLDRATELFEKLKYDMLERHAES